MQIKKNSSKPISVAVLLFDSFSNHCLANAIEPLRAANNLTGQKLYEWRFLSLNGGPMTSSSGLTVKVDAALSDSTGGDFLFVMPSYNFEKCVSEPCLRALCAAGKRFKTLVGMDTGSWLLASAGLLSGRRATIHWDELDHLAESFPEVTVIESRVVHDNDIRSCGGATTTFELLLDLIEEHHGPMLRLEVATLFMHGETVPPALKVRPGKVLEAAVSIMRRTIEKPMSIDALARELGMSRKVLEKRCMSRFGVGPGKLYLATRLREAKRLLERSGMSIAEIAARCGYRDASAMTRAFRQEFGRTPRDLRHEQAQKPLHSNQ